MQAVNMFSSRGVRALSVGIIGMCLCSAGVRPAWADKDEHEGHKHKKTEVHVHLPGIHVDVEHGRSPAESYIIQTRGPVHEAFAEPVVFDPAPGLIVPQRPPEPIEEIPPAIMPTGTDVAWVPGYWAFDDDRSSFIWVSGIWRNMPAGQEYVPGYWREVSGGYQWVSGFWQAVNVQEIQYLPPPPPSMEAEPAVIQATSNNIWVPGVWLWRKTGYQWRPGYWMAPQENWVWVPDHYVWAPAGCVFVSGYWDYAIPRRGVLFAPVYIPPTVTHRVAYTPSVVVNASLLVGGLFARPSYCHYYFGDYYERTYFRRGIYPAYSFHGSRYGYDPAFAHYLAVQRHDRAETISRLRDDYHYRRDHKEARPPHTYTEWQKIASRRDINPRLASMINMVQPLSRVAEAKNSSLRFQSVQEDRVKTYRQSVLRTRQYQEERRRMETPRSITQAPIDHKRSVTRAPEKAPAVTPGAPVAPGKPQPSTPPRGVSIPRRQEDVQKAQPAKPAPRVQKQDQPIRLKFQRSPLSGRPLNKVERNAAPPSAPKAVGPEPKARPRTVPPPGKRPEPKD